MSERIAWDGPQIIPAHDGRQESEENSNAKEQLERTGKRNCELIHDKRV
jgi:hypothetical protein